MFDENENHKFDSFARKYAPSFRCIVKKGDDTLVFVVPDIHIFCLRMYDYFSDDCEVFEVRVEKE